MSEQIDYSQPTPEADAFYNQIYDSEIDGGAVHAMLKEFECQRNHYRAQLAASRGREGKMRELLSSAVCNDCRNSKVIRYSDGPLSPCPWCERRRQALSPPSDGGVGGWLPVTSTGRKHHLKTWEPYFTAVKDGRKAFEVRLNDRDFEVGDVLVLQQYDPKWRELTGDSVEVVVTFLLPGGQFGLEKDFVVLGIKPLPPPPTQASAPTSSEGGEG